MDNLITISEVTKAFNISTRTLRYYEQIGLIESMRMEGYAYRVYDEKTIVKIKQIIILRKLRFSLKEIGIILGNNVTKTIVTVFENNIAQLDNEIVSLSTIKDILVNFSGELNKNSNLKLDPNFFDDKALASMLIPLSLSKLNLKKEHTMDELNRAEKTLSKLEDTDVRIVFLPPATIAAYQYEGDNPEEQANKIIDDFVKKQNLVKLKPDLRHYGFNSPNPTDESGSHGYEIWITIPDDLDVPEPLTKKSFEGGLYAAHMIPFGAFDEWGKLSKWAETNEKYEYHGDWNPQNMFGCMEEALNYVNRVNLPNPESDDFQLDLLFPIKEK